MLLTYRILEQIAKTEFSDIVKNATLIGGKSAQPNKLRVFLIDGSFLDFWLSEENDYSFHWEQRAVRGLIHRWDNAPDHPEVESFPHLEFKKNNPETQILALDNLKRRGSELNLPRLKQNGIEFIHGDIRNREDLESAGKADLIIECSAEPSVMAGYNSSPEYLINTNLLGTVNCLEYARKRDADVVFLSTSRVYPMRTINNLDFIETSTRFELSEEQSIPGASSKGFTEDFPLHGPRTLYGATKLASELILQEYIEMYGIRGVINRCGLLTGSWQMGKVDQGVIVLWVAKHHYQQSLSYIGFGGQGKQVRDILHVKDLYRLLEIQINDMDSHNGEIYNVGGGLERTVSLLELTRLCQEYTGNKIPMERVNEDRAGDIRIYITDNSKITEKTGWKPEISVDQIIQEISVWIGDNSEQLRPILA